MVFTTDALVLRCVDVGDYDRLMTILTPENGQISVMAKGARSKRSVVSSVTQPFIYANFEIYRKNDMNWLRGGNVIEHFSGIHEDLEKLALSTYLSDIARESTGEFIPAVDILRMTLNSLYGISKDKWELRIIKAVYEWRTAGYAGYMPDLSGCCGCHCPIEDIMYLDVMNGRLLCQKCLHKYSAANINSEHALSAYEDTDYERRILIPMGAGAVAAAQYALTALPERMFAFKIKSESDTLDFCRAGETFLLNHLERSFDSLEFYKVVKK